MFFINDNDSVEMLIRSVSKSFCCDFEDVCWDVRCGGVFMVDKVDVWFESGVGDGVVCGEEKFEIVGGWFYNCFFDCYVLFCDGWFWVRGGCGCFCCVIMGKFYVCDCDGNLRVVCELEYK